MNILEFISVWILMTFALTWISRWNTISEEDITHLKSLEPFYTKHFSSMWLNWVGFRSCVVVKFYTQGIYMKPYFIVAPLSKGIFIPYLEMELSSPKSKIAKFLGYGHTITYNNHVLYPDLLTWEMIKRVRDKKATFREYHN